MKSIIRFLSCTEKIIYRRGSELCRLIYCVADGVLSLTLSLPPSLSPSLLRNALSHLGNALTSFGFVQGSFRRAENLRVTRRASDNGWRPITHAFLESTRTRLVGRSHSISDGAEIGRVATDPYQDRSVKMGRNWTALIVVTACRLTLALSGLDGRTASAPDGLAGTCGPLNAVGTVVDSGGGIGVVSRAALSLRIVLTSSSVYYIGEKTKEKQSNGVSGDSIFHVASSRDGDRKDKSRDHSAGTVDWRAGLQWTG